MDYYHRFVWPAHLRHVRPVMDPYPSPNPYLALGSGPG